MNKILITLILMILAHATIAQGLIDFERTEFIQRIIDDPRLNGNLMVIQVQSPAISGFAIGQANRLPAMFHSSGFYKDVAAYDGSKRLLLESDTLRLDFDNWSSIGLHFVEVEKKFRQSNCNKQKIIRKYFSWNKFSSRYMLKKQVNRKTEEQIIALLFYNLIPCYYDDESGILCIDTFPGEWNEIFPPEK